MRPIFILAALAASISLAAVGAEPAPARYDSGTISGLGARNIGSAAMSGRIAALAGHLDGGKLTLYVGSASGGVWKTTDGGTTFKPVFDKEPVQSIGAVALDPSDPKVVWVGTGEVWTRNSVSIGNGIYRSGDAGESWKHMGLPESERISKIIVHPRDGNTVYACVPGRLWSDSAERGLYRTRDGGRTWSLILKGSNLSTGCSSLTMDPKDPGKLFAALWDFRRKGWTFRSGGEGPESASGSGLYVTNDGGEKWSEVGTGEGGFGPKPYGRIAVTIAPSDPNVVYAVVESTRSALFRSDDAGKTWEERDRSQSMVWRPFYFSTLIVDPKDPDRVFKPNYTLIVSTDGGKSFSPTSNGTHGDHHDVWINPENTQHVISGDDGGLWISYNGGNQWVKNENLPLSQFYHVSVDEADPYRVYGGLQDNSSWVGESAYPGGVTNHQWENLYGGDGFWVFSDPSDPDYVYAEYQGGYISRINRKTHETRDIQPKAQSGEKLRFNWNTPVHMSPNEKGTLYIGSQFLFRSRNQGQSWDRISPDLSSNDPAKQKQEESGGVTVDNSAAEMHTTIFSISESPRAAATIWVGTDDGKVQLTRNGGGKWEDVTGNIRGLPEGSWTSWVEASRHDDATAYAVFDRHTYGDFDPWVFRTRDHGKSWTRIVAPAQGVRGYAHVIKEDSVDPDVLFLGTEFGLWISIDGGAKWAGFNGGGFPNVAVRDLVVQARDSDLVIATHGRGIWIIDDITPLRHLNEKLLSQEAAFVAGRPSQQRINGSGGWANGDAVFVGENPAGGATITYFQRTRHLFGDLKIEVLDASGKVIDTIPASKRRGINRVSWTMRAKPPRVPRAAQLAYYGTQGPRLLPGNYTVRMTKNKQVYETPLVITLDRRAKFNIEDRKAQFDAAMRVHAMFGQLSDLVDRIAALQQGAADRAGGLPEGDALRGELEQLSAKADVVRKKIVATKEGGAITGEERLREHTDTLYGAILSWEGRPGDYQIERIAALRQEYDAVQAEFQALASGELDAVNAKLEAKQLEAITLPPAPAG